MVKFNFITLNREKSNLVSVCTQKILIIRQFSIVEWRFCEWFELELKLKSATN